MTDDHEVRKDARDFSKTGRNAPRVRKLNELLVLDLVRRNGPSTRPWIAEQLDLEYQTVSNICSRLISSEFLADDGIIEGLRRQSRGVIVNPRAAFAVGVEIRRTEANVALVGLDGKILDSKQLNVPGRSVRDVLADVVQTSIMFQNHLGSEAGKIVGVGISVPGPIDATTGTILEPTNFEAWHGLAVGSLLEEQLGLPTWVNTTAISGALGEQWAAAGSAYDDFVYIHFGAGIGLGIIANGRPISGSQGNAGEFAHLVADPNGPQCHCGQRGCLVQFATPQGLLAALQWAWVEEHHRDPLGVTPIPKSYEEGFALDAPQWLADALDATLATIASAIYRIIVTLDPSAVILGGPTTAKMGSQLIEKIHEAWTSAPTFGRSIPAFEVAKSAASSGAVGAASLPLHSQFSPRAFQ